MRTVLVCDLGGTRMKIGILRDGKLVAKRIEPSHADEGLAPQLPTLKTAWLRLLEEVDLRLQDCAGISVAFASLVNPTTGRVLTEYGKFADAPGLDLRAWARQELGLPLAIENDARMALLGEWRAGAARGVDNVVLITLGTGLGTSAIIEGNVLRGAHGQAGVLGGHLTLRYGGRPCTCGNIGCAEAEASSARLAELAKNRNDFPASSLPAEPKLDFKTVLSLAKAGDACAIALREHCLLVWSSLAVNLIHAYDPEVLILGGGIMGSADTVLHAVRSHVSRYAHTPWGKVRVVASELGDHSALMAGEWLLLEQFPQLAS